MWVAGSSSILRVSHIKDMSHCQWMIYPIKAPPQNRRAYKSLLILVGFYSSIIFGLAIYYIHNQAEFSAPEISPCQVAGKEPRVFNLDLAERSHQPISEIGDGPNSPRWVHLCAGFKFPPRCACTTARHKGSGASEAAFSSAC